jgi:uncharacterized membrane protein
MNAADDGRRIPLRIVLLVLATMLALGLLIKVPCVRGDTRGRASQVRFCYSDIVPLFSLRHLNQGRFPYLQTRVEYPVLTGLYMGVLAPAASSEGTFLLLNAAGLALAAFGTAVILYRVAGDRALYFAAAPSLVWYAFLNWDLLAVLLATAAVWAYLSRRPVAAGILLGLGTSAKLYPALLLLPFIVDSVRTRGRKDAMAVAGAASVTWLAVNLPFAILAFRNWSLFYRFNTTRGTEFNTLWFIGCHRLTGHLRCPNVSLINVLAAVSFVVAGAALWWVKARRSPSFPRWTLGFPLLLIFLLTTKIYSPQYALWILPWFALVLPDLRLFSAFLIADAAVFFTEFAYLRHYFGVGGLPALPLELAILARAAVLAACLVAYVSRSDPGLEGVASWRNPPPRVDG